MSKKETTAPPRQGGGPGGGHGHGAAPTQKSMDFVGSSKRLLKVLRPERLKLVLILILTVISVGLAVLGPKILGNATNLIFEGVIGRQLPAGITQEQAIAGLREQGQDQIADMLTGMQVIPGQGVDFTLLRNVLLGVLLLFIGAWAFGWIQGLVTTGVVQRTVYRMRQDVETKLSRLPLSYFDKQSRGDVLSRVTNDIDNISQTLQQTMSQLITALLTVIGVLGMMIWISPVLAVIAVVTIPLSVFVTVKIAKRSQPHFTQQWKKTGTLNAHIEEMFTGHSLVKIFGREEQARDEFDVENEGVYQASFKAQFISGTIQPAMMFISNLNYVLVAVVGGLRVASGTMTLGDVQAFIQYSRQFTQPLTQVASMMNLLQSGVASAERVFELLDAEEQSSEPQHPAEVAQVRGRVAFENVSFRYDPQTPLIEGLDLTAEPGQTIAIVGHTGAGKTTLVNILMRFYEVNSGRITLDGVNTAQMSRPDLRSNMAMVLQDTWLFGGTIAENIRYGRLDATDEEVIEAAKATYVDRFVRSLPDGYDTVLDDEGGSVSAGEKQLITIARAFLTNAPILILDEATSSVDTRTELLVQQAMNALRVGRTSFVIAHRLSTIRDADVIVVMDSGAIVEQGSHDQLLEAGGAYADLYNSQFAQPIAEVAQNSVDPGAELV